MRFVSLQTLVLLSAFLLICYSYGLTAQEPKTESTTELSEHLEPLISRIAEIEEKMQQDPKDFWDKFGVITPLLSGILVALIGFYATNIYNRRQREAEANRKDSELLVAQVQTVEKFLPHLSAGSEERKKAALIAITALGNAQLAVKLARVFGGSGSTSALTDIAQTESPEIAEAASNALTELFEYLKSVVVTIHEKDARRASGFVATETGLVVTAAHAIKGIAATEIQIGLPDGRLVAAKLLSSNSELDLALLLCTTNDSLPRLEIAPSRPRLGNRIVALMVSLSGQFITRVGHVSGLEGEATVSFGDHVRQLHNRIAVDLRVEMGSSGAPVLDDTGRLLGIIQASDRKGHTYLISADVVAEFIEESNHAA